MGLGSYVLPQRPGHCKGGAASEYRTGGLSRVPGPSTGGKFRDRS